jgi:L-alanine-DL-glutamate epimerase-like enolase superfamily enzyme
MVKKALLIDLNERIEHLENFVELFLKAFGSEMSKGRKRELEEYGRELEELRQDLDRAIDQGHVQEVEKDIQFLEKLDQGLSEFLEEYMHGEAVQIHKELSELLREVE